MSQITKRALASALKELLEHKPLNKITIADITEQCGVNRQTFYYHFQDIYALLEWIYTTDAQRLLEGKRDGDTWQQGFLQVLEYIRDNRALVRNTYHSVSRELLEGYLYRVTYQLMRDVVEERAAGTQVPEEDRAFLAHFYKYAFVGLTVEWMQGGMKEEPARLVSRVNTVMEGNIAGAGARWAGRNAPLDPQMGGRLSNLATGGPLYPLAGRAGGAILTSQTRSGGHGYVLQQRKLRGICPPP